MGRNNVIDNYLFIYLFSIMTSFVKKLVKWCEQNWTSSSSLMFFGKTFKNPKNKVEDPWTPSKQTWKPPTLFPPIWNLQNDKRKIEDFKFSKYENKKISKFTWKRHIPCFFTCENFTHKIWRSPEMTKKK